jgi:uncharacterized membrane protein
VRAEAAVHPFDIKTVLFEKHAQHVVLIHFPIALFLAGVFFDFLWHWTRRRSLAAAACCNFSLAALSTIPTLITGILAWQWQLEGQRLKGLLLWHLLLGCLSAACIWIVWLIHCRAQRTAEKASPAYRLVLEALGVVLVVLTGHLGGFLSGVNVPS